MHFSRQLLVFLVMFHPLYLHHMYKLYFFKLKKTMLLKYKHFTYSGAIVLVL